MPEVRFYADLDMTTEARPGGAVAADSCNGKWLRIDRYEYRPTFTGTGSGWQAIHYGRPVAAFEAGGWERLFAHATRGADQEAADEPVAVEGPHMAACDHHSFDCQVTVNRLQDQEGGPVTAWDGRRHRHLRRLRLEIRLPGHARRPAPREAVRQLRRHRGPAADAAGCRCGPLARGRRPAPSRPSRSAPTREDHDE